LGTAQKLKARQDAKRKPENRGNFFYKAKEGQGHDRGQEYLLHEGKAAGRLRGLRGDAEQRKDELLLEEWAGAG
jgi:hypothetical protein